MNDVEKRDRVHRLRLWAGLSPRFRAAKREMRGYLAIGILLFVVLLVCIALKIFLKLPHGGMPS